MIGLWTGKIDKIRCKGWGVDGFIIDENDGAGTENLCHFSRVQKRHKRCSVHRGRAAIVGIHTTMSRCIGVSGKDG